MHVYECTNKGTQTQEKQNILQYEIQNKSHNNTTKNKTIFFFYLRYLYKNLIVSRGLSYLW